MDIYFSQHFGVEPQLLDEYGALDISVVSDLPLFVDPFLLFNSDDPKYQQLHAEILRYLRFLRDLAAEGDLDEALIKNLYRFREVKQNWLGFTLFGNDGAGLGKDFAFALHDALADIFADFGREKITRGTHLEKLCLIRAGIGKDNISDFATNLIKGYLCEYTERFARMHLAADRCATFQVPRASFNYDTETWQTRSYFLPRLRDDFVLLTPLDILTRDDTWISQRGMISNFARLPAAVPNTELRAQINRYFKERLGSDPNAKQKREAAIATIARFPELIDRYIKLQEDDGSRAQLVSSRKVQETQRVLVEQLKAAISDLEVRTEFYRKPWSSYDECLERATYFKSYVEDNDGYKLLNRAGRPFATEAEVQLAFGLVWCKSELDINREPNNGRGPVDFKASFGAGDKSLIEFKLGSNSQLRRNLEKQVPIYEKANRTRRSVKVIVYYTEKDESRVKRILKELDLERGKSIVLIDARKDNKPSASRA
ncbi:hypothetical protein [Candidatus Solirubrobacter pratensis]|uniref:hypothetical protein n=1 Tax=Candidatus Solirubrobacter pratensis TaxID=1298857 RepID=UPI0004284F7D|nr:hypothetical protein [Candidatus Solirubrobacter pratensis]